MILQTHLPIMPWMREQSRKLPGVSPVSIDDWLMRDDAYAAQMAYRDRLIDQKRDDVYVVSDGAREAAQELLQIIVDECVYPREGDVLTRPDGTQIDVASDEPLIIAGRLVQEDLVILQDQGDEHHLTAGIMCFPAHWTPKEKFGKSLTGIHTPVPEYDGVANVVQRMFRAIRPEQPLMRANFLIYTDPELHQPRPEGISKPIEPSKPRFVRVERQTFRKLPETGAVVFAIHTFIVPAIALNFEALNELAALKPELIV